MQKLMFFTDHIKLEEPLTAMHLSGHLRIYMVVLIGFCSTVKAEDTGESNSLVTIDAAYAYHRTSWDADWLFLFSGNKICVLIGKKESHTADRPFYKIPDDMHLQAAFVKDPIETAEVRFYYGDKYGFKTAVGGGTTTGKRLKYGPKRAFIRKGGPDAIGRRNDVVYVFKGCKVGIRHSWDKWELALNDVKTIGLPCNADAAWGEFGGAMVVLKGDQVWRWESDDSVNGPHAFHDTYTLKDWTLKPSGETK